VDALLVVLGVILILVGLVDMFLAVLHHDAVSFLTPVLYRWTWVGTRTLTRPLPFRLSTVLRALAAPWMVLLTLLVWLGTQAVGFALVYYPGVKADGLFLADGVRRSFGTAFTFSTATLASLGLGSVSPRTLAYQAISAGETLIGLLIITFTISYILNVYNVLQSQNAVAAALHHQAEDGSDPRTILAPHFVDGRPEGLSTHLREFHRSLVDQAEGLRRYPIVYYFKSGRAYRSIPYVFHMMGGVVAALRWGLPTSHPAARDPWLPSLATGYTDVMREVEHHFVPRVPRGDQDPVPFDRFKAALAGDAEGDERLAEFLELDRFMRDLAEIDDGPDPHEAYRRYCEWLPFATESAAFVSRMADDLGTDMGRLTAEPESGNF
ncbi:MAG TPA: potassium channel family protein, partial [Acidimicrobiales bacterium]|nr:potassium channel family protein [Acidimicrobiales bacterium]